MRGRTVLILLVIVVGLVAFIELYEHELPSSEERATMERLVLPMDPIDVEGIRIRGDEQSVLLAREELREVEHRGDLELSSFAWRILEPMEARADSTLVVSLLESLTDLEKKRTLENGDRQELGLDPPNLVVDLSGSEGDSTLLVGSEVPAGNSMIVGRADSEEIFVVDNLVWPDLNREPGEWRDRQILPVGQEGFRGLTLSKSDLTLDFVKRDDEFWLEEPIVDRADSEKMGDLVTALASMRVVSFVDEPSASAADYGLDPPVGEVTVALAETDRPVRVQWGSSVAGSNGQRYAASDEQIVTTETDLTPFIEASLASWRSLDLTTLETFQIDELRVEQLGFESMTLRREGANWRRGEEEVSFPSVSDLLYSLADARARELLDRSTTESSSLVDSEPHLEVLARGANRSQTMSFFASSERGVPVTVSDREVVLFVEQDEFTEILAKVGLVREAETLKTEANEQLPPVDANLSSDQ